MDEQSSPWSRPDTPVEVSASPAVPADGAPEVPQSRVPLSASQRQPSFDQASRTPTAVLARPANAGLGRAGAVTRTTDQPDPDVLQFGKDDDDPIVRNKLLMRWFGGVAGLVVLGGLVVVLVMVFGGSGSAIPSLFDDKAAPPPDTRPELVKNCPPPSSYPEAQPAPAPPPGPRTVDEESGVSYQAYGEPWEPWPMVWTGGTLRVSYKIGQHFVTENYSGGSYHASILSASVPATVNDGLAIDLKCTGRQVAADVRTQYYPNPNRVEDQTERETLLGGRPAWVTTFRLHFSKSDLKAKSELVGIALSNVGKPEVAIVYISIPDTHRQWDKVVDEVLNSVRAVA